MVIIVRETIRSFVLFPEGGIMTAVQTEIRLTRIAGCSETADNVIMQHDYGQVVFAWSAISHVFAVRIRNLNGEEVPILLIGVKGEEGFFYVNGNKINFRLFQFLESKIREKKSKPGMGTTKTADLQEHNFKWLSEEICARLTSCYIDRPLVECVRSGMLSFPNFNTLKDAAAYCENARTSFDPQEAKGITDTGISDDELKKISAPATERKEWVEGTVIEDRYTVHEIIYGGMGVVYIVFDIDTIKYYAMKTFQEKYLWNDEVIAQFIREAEIWIGLGRHPYIVKAELVRMIEGKPYIFLEYIQGTDLEEYMAEGDLTVRKSIELAIQFCEGMHFANMKLGLIHRDIKPTNCMITRNGVLKITDFGLGKIFDKPLQDVESVAIAPRISGKKITSSSTALVGTLLFMAPELFTNVKASSIQSDIYSFGIMLYMMLVGTNPFQNEEPTEVIMNHINLIPEDPYSLNEDVPPSLSCLVLECIEKDPELRFRSFLEIKQRLEKIYRDTYGAAYTLEVAEEVFSEDDWMNRGISLASLERHKEALVTFGEAIRINPNMVKAHILMGISFLKTDQIDESLYCFEAAKELAPDNWEVWFHQAEALAKTDRLEEAKECLEQAIDLSPETPEIYATKAIILSRLGNLDEAFRCFDLALEKNPKMDEIWVQRGALFHDIFKFDAASQCFSQAIEINPRNHGAWFHRGTTLFMMGFYSEARSAYQKALSLVPDNIDYRKALADYHLSTGNLQQAQLSVEQMQKRKKDCVQVFAAKARIADLTGLTEQALKILRHAETIRPGNAEVISLMARYYYKIGDYGKAHNCCIGLDEKHDQGWQCRLLADSAAFWIEKGEFMLDQCALFESRPSQDPYRDFHSLLSTFCSIDDAYGHMMSAVEPGRNPERWLLLAKLQLVRDQPDDAQRSAEQAMNCGSGYPPAKVFIETMLPEILGEDERHQKKKGILAVIRKREIRHSRDPQISLILGLRALHHGEFSEAPVFFQEAITADPDLHVCWFFAGYSLMKINDVEKAEQLIRTFVDNMPHSPGYYRYRLFDAMSDLSRAEKDETYWKWLGIDPADYEPWFSYLQYLLDSGRDMRAYIVARELSRTYALAWRLSKRGPEYWEHRGIIELIARRPERAVRFFERSLKLNPLHPLGLIGAGTCYEIMDREKDALQAYEKLQGLNISVISGLYRVADLMQRKKREKDASSAIDRALVKKPDSAILKSKKAHILLEFDHFKEFFTYFSSAYDQNSTFPMLSILRARSLLSSGMETEALAFMESALATHPESIPLMKMMGSLYLTLKFPAKALECYERLHKADELVPDALLGKGIACFHLQNYEACENAFRLYLRFVPLNPFAWLYLGASHFLMGDREGALVYFKKSVEEYMDFSPAWSTFGIFFHHDGNHAEALQCAERALRTDKANVSAWLCRGESQKALGNNQEAHRSFEQALFCDPRHSYAWLQRGIIEITMNDCRLALASFSKACQIDDKKAPFWYNRGLAALDNEDMNEFRKSIVKALTLDQANINYWCAKLLLHHHEKDQEGYEETRRNARVLGEEKLKWLDDALDSGSVTLKTLPISDEMPFPFEIPLPFAMECPEPFHGARFRNLDRDI
jgi:tetratricopeptide (TPR) repeat protein/tRNA A-37 threonylcarbamoyl transferase component Bud32